MIFTSNNTSNNFEIKGRTPERGDGGSEVASSRVRIVESALRLAASNPSILTAQFNKQAAAADKVQQAAYDTQSVQPLQAPEIEIDTSALSKEDIARQNLEALYDR